MNTMRTQPPQIDSMATTSPHGRTLRNLPGPSGRGSLGLCHDAQGVEGVLYGAAVE